MEKCKLEKNKNDINVNVPSPSNPSTINQINRNLLKKTSMQALDEKWNNIEETININKNNILLKNSSNNTQNNQPKPSRYEDVMLKGKNILNSLDEYNKNGVVINNEKKDDKSNSKNKKIKGGDKNLNLNIMIDYKKILHAYDNEFEAFCKDKIDFFNKIKDEIYAKNIALVNNNNNNCNCNNNNNINTLNMIFNNTFNTFNNNSLNNNTNTDNPNSEIDVNSKEYIIKKKIENLKNFDFSSKVNNNDPSNSHKNNNNKPSNINNNNDPYNLNSTSIPISNSSMNTLHRKNHKNIHDKMIKYNNKTSNQNEPEIIKGKNNPLFTSNTPNNTVTIVKNDKKRSSNITSLNNLNNKLFRNYTTKRLRINDLNDDQTNNNENIPYNSFLNMNKGFYKSKNSKKSSKVNEQNLRNINFKNDINSMITIINKSKGNRGSKSVCKIKNNKDSLNKLNNNNAINNSLNALNNNNNNTNKSHDERFKQQIYNMCDYLKASKKNNSNCISKRNINNNNLNINLNMNNMYNTNKNFYDKNEYSTECYLSNFSNSNSNYFNVSNDIKGMISNTFSSNYKMYDGGDNNIYSVNKIGNNINSINSTGEGINGVNINTGNRWLNENDNDRENRNKVSLLMNYSLLQKFNDNEKLITSLKLRKK